MMNSALLYREFGLPQNVIRLETAQKSRLAENNLRVKMLYVPVNASDLIPVLGSYLHRIKLPQVAGYEGVGIVSEAPADFSHLIGHRVLPLRGEGTWQQFVDCPAALAIPVPDEIDNTLAARAYINPLAAHLMIQHFSPAGKHVLITAAGSDCALLIGQWAMQAGAASVTGIHRSAVHAVRLRNRGITPVSDQDTDRIKHFASQSCIVYDATGGYVAETILSSMPSDGLFISYGLLSGQPFSHKRALPKLHWFHLRHYLPSLDTAQWQQTFQIIWPRLAECQKGGTRLFSLNAWTEALTTYQIAGRVLKPLIKIN